MAKEILFLITSTSSLQHLKVRFELQFKLKIHNTCYNIKCFIEIDILLFAIKSEYNFLIKFFKIRVEENFKNLRIIKKFKTVELIILNSKEIRRITIKKRI